VSVLTNKYYNGIVPQPNEFSEVDVATLTELKAYPAVISSSVERYRFREALGELMNVARLGNKYLADEEPWKVIKDNPERVQTQMYVALQIAAALSSLRTVLYLLRNYPNLKGRNPLPWSAISETSDLIPADSK
jgi:methionyl-tRNA synthetase